MNKFLLSALLWMSLPFLMKAQLHPDSLFYKNITWEMLEGRFYTIDVNGVEIGDTLSQKQFIEHFGKPDEIFNQDESRDGELGVEVGFRYHDNYFETLDKVFWEFHIFDPAYRVLTKYFKGGIGVGDNISVFKGFKDGVLYKWENLRVFKKNHYQLLNGSDGFYLNIITDDAGNIRYLYYVEPV